MAKSVCSSNRIEAAQTEQNAMQARITELLSKTEDTDYAKTVSDYAQQQTTYQASLQAAAKSLQQSLMDYLR